MYGHNHHLLIVNMCIYYSCSERMCKTGQCITRGLTAAVLQGPGNDLLTGVLTGKKKKKKKKKKKNPHFKVGLLQGC